MSLDLDQVFITILYYNNFPVKKPPPLSNGLDWPVLLWQSQASIQQSFLLEHSQWICQNPISIQIQLISPKNGSQQIRNTLAKMDFCCSTKAFLPWYFSIAIYYFTISHLISFLSLSFQSFTGCHLSFCNIAMRVCKFTMTFYNVTVKVCKFAEFFFFFAEVARLC